MGEIGKRKSNIELFRIITMLCIVAHHYVVNSGLTKLMNESPLTSNSIFLTFFGGFGKTGINCFLLITGYYMCQSHITPKKFLKLLCQVEFYKIVLYIIFLITGYIDFSVKGCIAYIFPITQVRTGFTFSYLAFYLLIPFMNKLIHALNQREHALLTGLLLSIYTVLPSLNLVTFDLDYVVWFGIVYLVAAYIRIYSIPLFNNRKICTVAMIGALIVSLMSEAACVWIGTKIGKPSLRYFLVADSNKILALLTAVCAFMFFKNLNLKYSRCINAIAASCFGVLMIHANSDTMRQWLWKDTLKNTEMFNSNYLMIHAIVSVLAVYCICTVLDMIRIKLIEAPFFYAYDKIFCKRSN